MTDDEIIQRAIQFLESIGIGIEEGKVGADCFVPGIEIRNGKVIFERSCMRHPGDIFHEAGHIAVSEPSARKSLSGISISNGEQKEGEEIAAILWSYLAASHAGVPLSAVFHESGYKGESSWIAGNFQEGNLVGLPLLEWMKIAERTPEGAVQVVSWLRN